MTEEAGPGEGRPRLGGKGVGRQGVARLALRSGAPVDLDLPTGCPERHGIPLPEDLTPDLLG